MPRAIRVMPASERDDGPILDTLILTFAQRQAHKGFVFGVRGICVELDLDEPTCLRTDDALVLENGAIVEIVAEAEPVTELRLAGADEMARLAWLCGDRHVPIQILKRRLRLRVADAEFLPEAVRSGLVAIEAPFEPESTTLFAAGTSGHSHHHHVHDHQHEHHDHGDHQSHGHGPHGHGAQGSSR